MAGAVSFAFYAALVKNLRGVILFNPEDERAWSRIEWLRKRFRYRNLGITPSVNGEGVEELLRSGVFRRLYYPLKDYEELVDAVSAAGIDRLFAEAVVFSSTYISPLLILSEKYLREASKYSAGVVRACKKLDNKDWKLHLRIADYTILDSYEAMVRGSMEYIRGISDEGVRRGVLAERRAFTKKDARRYWRIACEEGDPFLLYLDPLLILEGAGEGVLSGLTEEHAAALAIVPAVNLCVVGAGPS